MQKDSKISNRWFKDFKATSMMPIQVTCYKNKWIVHVSVGSGRQMELQSHSINRYLSNRLARTVIKMVHRVHNLTKTSTLTMRIGEQGLKLLRLLKITEACSSFSKPIAWRIHPKLANEKTCSLRWISPTGVTLGLKAESLQLPQLLTTITRTKTDLDTVDTRTQTTSVEVTNLQTSLETTVTLSVIMKELRQIRKNNHQPTSYYKWTPKRGLVINKRTLITSLFSTRKTRIKKQKMEIWHLKRSPQEVKRKWIKTMNRKGILQAQAWWLTPHNIIKWTLLLVVKERLVTKAEKCPPSQVSKRNLETELKLVL